MSLQPIQGNTQAITIIGPAPIEPSPLVLFYLIQNADLVSSGSCRDLSFTHIQDPCSFDNTIHQLARVNIFGDQRQVELHEKIASLDFDNLIFHDEDDTQVIAADSLTIIALSDEEYEAMVNDFAKSGESKETVTSSPATKAEIRCSPTAFIKAVAQYFKKEQEIVDFMRLAREEELARVDEDTRERQTKERDKLWNQRMDYWLKKGENQRQILSDALTSERLKVISMVA